MTAPMVTAESLVGLSGDAFAAEFGIPIEAPVVVEAPVVDDTPLDPAAEAAMVADITGEAATPTAEGEAAPVAEEPAAEEVVVPEGRTPITEFRVMDAEGELEIPDIEIEYKANGVVHRETLDKVVRLAQYGKYNEALVQERDQLKVVVGEHEAVVSDRDAALAARESQIERLLTDPDFLARAQEAYDEYNDPTQRAARAEQELAASRQAAAATAASQKMFNFVAERVAPAYEAMLEKYPAVPADEMWGRFTRLTAPLQVRGEIPEHRWGQVEKLLVDDIGPWAAQLNDERTTTARSKSDASAAAVRLAQEESTRAKNAIARAVKPVGALPTAAKPKPINSADDAVASIHAMLDGL